MKTKLYIYRILPALLAVAFLFASCSSPLQRYDDAIRIKPDSVKNYRWNKFNEKFRNGSLLRGTVIAAKLIKTEQPCPNPIDTVYQGFVVFVDSLSKETQYEYIPFEAINFVADTMKISQDTALLFENFNNPEGMRQLRLVKIDTIFNDCNPCNCRPLNLPEFNLPKIKLSCIDRKFYRTFLELKAGYSIFTDKLFSGAEKGREGWSIEASSGVRFGDEANYSSDNWNPNWMFGATFSTGVNTLNTFNDEDITRPAVLTYLRWQSSDSRFLGLCLRPFIYGQFGITIDKLTLDLFRINWCDQCTNGNIASQLPSIELQPNVDWSLPISWGIGLGFDVPVLPILDISFDFGYRSLAFGELTTALDYVVPTGRRVDMFLFRFGFSF
jgi:hypothetical protein